MQIPFGSRKPNEKETELLTSLGFDLNSMEKQGRYYYLDVPNDPRIQVKKEQPAFDFIVTNVSLNALEVITITHKTAIYDNYVYFNLHKDNIKQALLREDIIPEKKSEFTDFQKKIADRLCQLQYICFEGGAERGYGKMIGAQLGYLKKYHKKNPEEHDTLINSKQSYKKLYDMFPDWKDVNKLQQKYESRDVGPFSAIIMNNDANDCRIM